MQRKCNFHTLGHQLLLKFYTVYVKLINLVVNRRFTEKLKATGWAKKLHT